MMSKQGNAMKLATMTAASLVLAASSASAQSDQAITVTRAGSQPSTAGTAANFTGSVRVDDRFKGSGEARISGATVTFEPGARTAWHTHPLGQNSYRQARPRPSAARRWSGRGNATWRYRLDPAGREALAWREPLGRNEPYRLLRSARRQDRRMDGAGVGRAIRALIIIAVKQPQVASRRPAAQRHYILESRQACS